MVKAIDADANAHNIMLLTNSLEVSGPGGRELLCKLNHMLLADLFGDRLILCEIARSRGQDIFSIGNALGGHIDGLTARTIGHALDMIGNRSVSRLFVDGSNFGGFIKMARLRFPHLEIITFFHNVEAKFFLGALRQTRTPRALGVLMANYLAERKAVHGSDIRICMSERDSNLLKRLYGRPATHISSLAMLDTGAPATQAPAVQPSRGFALFVGGNFHANRSGIQWFVENVAPRIAIKTVVVGRGFDQLAAQLTKSDKVVVAGAVDNLTSWYQGAQFVIAPIFVGSGMKTKVAEALMFGKKIIGTPEAFSGYEDVIGQVGWVCDTADDFVAAIGSAQASIETTFDPQLRAIYEQRYSYAAARSRFKEILSDASGIS